MFKNAALLQKRASFKHLRACFCTSKNEPKDLTTQTELGKQISDRIAADKKELQWRTPWHEKEGYYYSFLRTFYSEDNQAPLMKFIQQDINLTPTSIKKWWLKRKEKTSIAMQQYIPERNQRLGNELAAAHFTVYRGGAVKFYGEDRWVKKDELGQYVLPVHYQDDMYVQAIDCTDMEIYYEGLTNYRNLKQVEWLRLNGCEKLDDWALDRVSCLFADSLIYLDLRNMPLITHRGLGALYKMNQLKILLLDHDVFTTPEFEMVCLMLQELYPHLDIRFNEDD